MTIIIPPVPLPPFGGQAYNHITPFTYRDGLTYVEVLESLRAYIRDILVPLVDEGFDNLEEYVNAAVAELTTYVETSIAENKQWTEEQIAVLTTYVNDIVQQIIDDSIEVQDPVVAGLVGVPETPPEDRSLSREALDAIYFDLEKLNSGWVRRDRLPDVLGEISAAEYGVEANTPVPQNAALYAAFDAAEAMGGGLSIRLPAGPVTIDGHFSLRNYSSGLVGASSSKDAAVNGNMGSSLVAINQDGPVLDLMGFKYPYGMIGSVEFGNFTIEGDGTNDNTQEHGYGGATKRGISFGNVTADADPAPVGLNVHDIVITRTGGIPFYAKDTYLSSFTNIVASEPVNAKANNIPYFLHVSCNGNRFTGLGCRSLATSADTGIGGAIVAIPSETFQYHNTVYYGTWFENLHVPTDGTMFELKTNGVIVSDTQFFDCFKESGATGTSRFRLETVASLGVAGGNTIRGLIPGKGTDTLSIDTGVLVRQNNNLIEGVKGYRDANVTIDPGVTGTTVRLGGSFSGGTPFAVVDNSGNTTNTTIDEFAGRHIYGSPAGTQAVMRVNGVDLPHIKLVSTLVANSNPNMVAGTNSFRFTLGANITMGAPSNIQDKPLFITLVQDATGGRTVAWNSNYRFANATAPVLSTAPNKVDRFVFEYSGTGTWECISQSLGITGP